MSKTKKSTTTQQQTVDPSLAADSAQLTKVAQFLASLGFQPNRATTIAARTPAQDASFAATQTAAAAFGMPVAASTGAPAPTMSAGGILGYSTTPGYDEAMSKLPPEYLAGMQNIFAMLKEASSANTPVAQKKPSAKTTVAKSTRDNSSTGALSRFTAADRLASRENGTTLRDVTKSIGSTISGALRSMTGGKADKKATR